MRCVCHSIQLAMSYASAECLLRNLEYLIAETHNWFAIHIYNANINIMNLAKQLMMDHSL